MLARAGYAQFYVLGDTDAPALIDKAVELDPNFSEGWLMSGLTRVFLGRPGAIERLERALRLTPQDPHLYRLYNGMAQAHFGEGRYDEAASWCEKALRERPTFPPSLRLAMASHALAGRVERARAVLAVYLANDPDVRISNVRRYLTHQNDARNEAMLAGYRLAGMPE